MCHSKTSDLAAHTCQADMLIVAVGRAGLIKADMVKPNAVVVDVGMNYTPQGLRGDVDYASVEPRASWITPVPGGVGPVTTALILQNVATAALKRVAEEGGDGTGRHGKRHLPTGSENRPERTSNRT